jgi:hypothetical protein
MFTSKPPLLSRRLTLRCNLHPFRRYRELADRIKRQKELQSVAGELQAQRNMMVRYQQLCTALLSHTPQGKGKKQKVGSATSKQYKWKQERKK